MYFLKNAAVEGWILIVTNLHEEIQEDDVFDAFSKCGEIKSLHLNLDRRTGYAKGYALIEFGSFEEASEAIQQMNGFEILEKKLVVDWAFQDRSLTQGKKGK